MNPFVTCSRCGRDVGLALDVEDSDPPICTGCLTAAEDLEETSAFAQACAGASSSAGTLAATLFYMGAAALTFENLQRRLASLDAATRVFASTPPPR